jgi:UDP-N-acetylglucosamine--N-acetylmuramyl-(pentapeptide) pyrophosphoryl-undecaprenol N-acetylglucosamine transferase
VFGGSLGARSINNAAIEAFAGARFHVLHAAGTRDLPDLRAPGPHYDMRGYISDFGEALLACERLGVAPAEALALEDTASGIASAKAAGLTCIAVPQFAETDVSAADRVVDSLEELLIEA